MSERKSHVIDRAQIGTSVLELIQSPDGYRCVLHRMGEHHILSTSPDYDQASKKFDRHYTNWMRAYECSRSISRI